MDPGEELVNQAKLQQIDTICIPGPCAVTTAILQVGSHPLGLFLRVFCQKRKLMKKILTEISEREHTTVLFESPHRLTKLLKI